MYTILFTLVFNNLKNSKFLIIVFIYSFIDMFFYSNLSSYLLYEGFLSNIIDKISANEFHLLCLFFFFYLNNWSLLYKPFLYFCNIYIYIYLFIYELEFYLNELYIYNLQPALNSNLLNGFFNVHPFLIVLVYIYIFYVIYINIIKYEQFKKTEYLTLTCFNMIFFCALLLVYLALLLGTWWALQEISWVNWWTWDPVELINMLLLFKFLIIYHYLLKFFNNGAEFWVLFSLNILIVLCMCLIRSSFIDSVHTFLLFTPAEFKLLILLYVILFLWFTSIVYHVYIYVTGRYFIDLVISYFSCFMLILIYIIILSSFKTLLTWESIISASINMLSFILIVYYKNLFLLIYFLPFTFIELLIYICLLVFVINYMSIKTIISHMLYILFFLYFYNKNDIINIITITTFLSQSITFSVWTAELISGFNYSFFNSSYFLYNIVGDYLLLSYKNSNSLYFNMLQSYYEYINIFSYDTVLIDDLVFFIHNLNIFISHIYTILLVLFCVYSFFFLKIFINNKIRTENSCFILRYSTLKKSTQHSFKKRYPYMGVEREFFLKYNAAIILSAQPFTFEYVYWRKLKKIIKKLVKRKVKARFKIRYKFFKKKAWIFIAPNYPISRKSKNARMGKGIGSFVRWSIRLKRNHILLKFKRIKAYRIRLLTWWLESTFNVGFIYN